MRSSYNPPGPFTGQLIVAQGLDAGVERVAIARGALDQAAAAGRQVVDDLGPRGDRDGFGVLVLGEIHGRTLGPTGGAPHTRRSRVALFWEVGRD